MKLTASLNSFLRQFDADTCRKLTHCCILGRERRLNRSRGSHGRARRRGDVSHKTEKNQGKAERANFDSKTLSRISCVSRFVSNVSRIYYPTAKIAKSTKIDLPCSKTCSIPVKNTVPRNPPAGPPVLLFSCSIHPRQALTLLPLLLLKNIVTRNPHSAPPIILFSCSISVPVLCFSFAAACGLPSNG